MSESTTPPPGSDPTAWGAPDEAGRHIPDPVTLADGGHPSGGTPPQAQPEMLRLCRRCSTQTVTTADACPACGTAYVHEPWLNKNRLIAIGAVLSLLLVSIGGYALVRMRQDQVAEEQLLAQQQAAAAERAREAEEKAAAQAAAEKKAADAAAAEQTMRELMVPQIEKSVTKMAREHASQGAIDGWPRSTTCSPVAGQSIDNLNKTTTKFSCFVTTEKLGGGRSRGHYYEALMNWDTGRYTYGYQG